MYPKLCVLHSEREEGESGSFLVATLFQARVGVLPPESPVTRELLSKRAPTFRSAHTLNLCSLTALHSVWQPLGALRLPAVNQK